MDEPRWNKVCEVFAAALEVDVEERDAYLREACAGDEHVHELVADLLASDVADQNPLDAIAPNAMDLLEKAGSPHLSRNMVLAGRYRIDAYVAEGGMGQVYLAHDLDLDVALALKTIRPEVASDPATLRRFKQEVLLARSVTHTNVCRVFDLGRDDGTNVSFLTMEFLAGETLASRIKIRGAFDAPSALPLIRQMAIALDTAHRAGVIHRDFKSANVMLVPTGHGERVVVTDFGIAIDVRHSDGSDPATRDGGVGTPAYSSPEQVSGGPVSSASDLYAFGVVLFEMLTGQLPFQGKTPQEVAHAHVTAAPPDPRSLADIDELLEQTILRLLSKDPNDRYATAHDAVEALEGLSNDEPSVRHTLPTELDAFVGREEEIATLGARLSGVDGEPGTRLVTLCGLGGVGKTRLALRVGWESLSRWPGGVWFCDLSDARDEDGVARAVASGLNVPLGKEDPVQQLGHAIVGRGKCLVILDNFEQVVAHADATVGRWLRTSTDAAFLATSRERLQLRGETTVMLDTLDVATGAVELFAVRGREHRASFEVDASNREQVAEIVERLDGLPLAIELAAARLPVMSVRELRDRLEEDLRVLDRARLGRQATLTATLDWSWDLLQPWEQAAIAQLTVFEGGLSLLAAEAVIEVTDHADTRGALDIVQSLVDRSWLRRKAVRGTARFEMYATVKEYVARRLVAAPGAESRHGAFFAAMGGDEQLDSLVRDGTGALHAIARNDLDNLVVACRRALTRDDSDTAVSTYLAAAEVFALRGPFHSSVELGRAVLDMLEGDAPRLGSVLRAVGHVERFCGHVEFAREHFDRALALARETGSRREEGITLGHLGHLEQDLNRTDEARETIEASLAIHREIGNRRDEGNMLSALANMHLEASRIDEAHELYDAALQIHRDLGNTRSEAVVTSNLGMLHHYAGRPTEAIEHCATARRLYGKAGDRRGEGRASGCLAVIHHQAGSLEEARASYESALAIHREVGDRRHEGIAIGNLGSLLSEHGAVTDARDHYEAALAIHREVGDRRFEEIALGNLTELAVDPPFDHTSA